MSTETFVAFIAWLVDFAHSHCGSNINKSDFYLLHEHLNAVKYLCNKNIIISKPEKAARVVILNKQDYINKIADILNDTIKFTILGSVDDFDKTAIQEQGIQCELLRFYNEHLIPKMIYKKIHPIGSQTLQLCGLPKIHKPDIPQDQFYQWSPLPNTAFPSG